MKIRLIRAAKVSSVKRVKYWICNYYVKWTIFDIQFII